VSFRPPRRLAALGLLLSAFWAGPSGPSLLSKPNLATRYAAAGSSPGALQAQDRDALLRGEFPVDLLAPPSAEAFFGLVRPGYVPRFPDEEQARALLADAAWHFSAMIWGWDFRYTPSDATRQVAEVFSLTPRGGLQTGDPGLRVESVRLEGSVVWATISYVLPPAARYHYQAWTSSIYPVAQGRAADAAFPPFVEPNPASRAAVRQGAITAAVKEALRAYLRGVTYNKPRLVRGACVLLAVPRVFIASGQYTANVRLRLRVDEIIPYSQY